MLANRASHIIGFLALILALISLHSLYSETIAHFIYKNYKII